MHSADHTVVILMEVIVASLVESRQIINCRYPDLVLCCQRR